MVSRPGNPGGGLSPVLFLEGVRGVVGGEAVDHIQVFPQRIHILLGGQARADFGSTADLTPDPSPELGEGRSVGFGQEQMMRTDLAGDFDAAFLGGFDEQDFFFQRDVRDVDWAVVNGCDQDRGRHAAAFGMRHDGQSLRAQARNAASRESCHPGAVRRRSSRGTFSARRLWGQGRRRSAALSGPAPRNWA